MTSSDNDRPLGVPGIPRPATAESPAKPAPTTAANASPIEHATATAIDSRGERPGDSGLGVPRQVAGESRELTDMELAALHALEAQAERDAAEQTLQELLDRESGFQIPRWLLGPVVLVVAAMAGFFGLFVLGQVTSVVAQLSQFGEAAQIAIIVALSGCGLLILYVLIRLVALLVKLRTNRQVKIRALYELARRQNWHAMMLANEKLDEAKQQIVKYLREYPLDPKQESSLKWAGMTPEHIANLRRARDYLLDPNFNPGAETWLQEFSARFQSVLDQAARARYMATSWKVGVASAASPYPAIDTSIVLYWSFALIGDLCRIYNLKVDRMSTALILGKVIAAAYIGGNLQYATDHMVDTVSDELKNQLGTFGAKLAGGVATRFAEGAINVMLIRRLGRSTMLLLQPVGPLKK